MITKVKKIDRKKFYGISYIKKGKKTVKILIPKVLPKEIVEIKVNKGKIAELIDIKKESEERIKPECKHFFNCGGCSLQHIDYNKQFELKKETIDYLFKEFETEIVGYKANKLFNYRNRMDFIVREINNTISLGLRKPGNYSSFVEIDECLLMNDKSLKALKKIKEWIKNLKVSIYDLSKHKGCLRYVIAQGTRLTNLVSILVDKRCNNKELASIRKLKDISGIDNVVINYTDSLSDISQDKEFEVIKGNYILEEKFLDKKFRYPFNGFFQRNVEEFEGIVKKIREFIVNSKINIKNSNNKRKLVDLFSGIGLFSITLNDLFDKIIGCEISEEMVKISKENARINGAKSEFYVRNLYKEVDKILKSDDVVIVDPPRAGLGKKLIEKIKMVKPFFIIYVSCNPWSQREDLRKLKEIYDIKKILWFDAFPQTSHIESVVFMKVKD